MADDLDSAIISDKFRVPVTATRIENNGVILRAPGKTMILSATELSRLIAFIHNAPQLGHLAHFAPQCAPGSPQTDE